MNLFSFLAASGISLPSYGNVTYVTKGSILTVHQPIPFVLIILMMTSLYILSLQLYSV